VSEGLRGVIAAQVAQLDQMVPYTLVSSFQAVGGLGVADENRYHCILTALRQVTATGGLAELVHRVDAAEVLALMGTLACRAAI